MLELRRARPNSGNMVSSCPFAPYRHLKEDGSFGEDRKASFGIAINDEGESVFNCLACSSRGSLLWLCKELGEERGEDYSEIEEFVWQNEGIETLERAASTPAEPPPRAERVKVLEKKEAQDVYAESEYEPFRGSVPRYAAERGIPSDVCTAWDLGHDPDEGRLMFPIRRSDGALIGLKGRSYTGHKAKYFPYLPFAQGSWFYGENMLRPVEEDPRVVIVEGEIDVLKVWMAGYSALGLMGGSATKEHINKLEILERPLVLMPDPGATGQRWSKRLGDAMKDLVNVYDGSWADPERDPGDMVADEIREIVESATLRL